MNGNCFVDALSLLYETFHAQLSQNMLNVWFMIEFLGVFWPHLKVLEKLGKVLFSRASSVKYKPLNYVFIRPVDKC